MRERDRDGRTIKAIIKDSTDRELSKLSMPEMTPDMLRGMAKSAEKKKLRRYRKIAGAAAALVIVAVGAALVFNSLSTDVEADKNAKHEVVTEDGIIIEDEGWGSSSEDNWVITDWAEVEIAKATIPELIVPGYVPEGYEFEKLCIEENENAFGVEYLFVNEHDELILTQHIQDEMLEATHIYSDSKKIKVEDKNVYIINTNGKKEALVLLREGSVLDVRYSFSDEEIVRLINHLA